MIDKIAFSIGNNQITAPGQVPSGGVGSLPRLVGWGVSVLIIIAIFMSLFFMIWAGIDYTMSQGNKEKLQAAKSKLRFSIIGLVIILFALPIMWIYLGIFGIKLY